MAQPPQQQCSGCRLFLRPDGSLCRDTKGLNHRACTEFKAGRPFAPRFHGHQAKEIKFDPEQPQAWSFWVSDQQVLLMAWELDHNQYGHFRCFIMTLTDDGVETKPFAPGSIGPAFTGEVVVKGSRENDLWRSFGHEDEDQFDLERNLINKPREVKIYPSRKD
ncbi:hypothetical protein LCGC14_1662600 [marine sediment metagenome]|uniref:Uncharacterized protein n=1 Tax=marine sediment metagenome TaxID=412755 RepID=A0A0F9KTQ0_9ZZZZ